MIDETQFVCPHCKQQIKHCAGMSFGEIMSMRHNKQYQDVLLYRLRAENEKLRAAMHDIYEVYAGSEGVPFPETCPEAYLYGLVMEMAQIAAKHKRAAALKETGDE